MQKESKEDVAFSKKLILDIRVLLWIVTLGGLLLAVYCIHLGYLGSLGWITTLVGLPWSAHGLICSFYLNMSKSDHRVGGITYEKMMCELNQENGYRGSDEIDPFGSI